MNIKEFLVKNRWILVAVLVIVLGLVAYMSAPTISFYNYTRRVNKNPNYQIEKGSLHKVYIDAYRHPRDAQALSSLSTIQFILGDYTSAEKNYLRVLQLSPDNIDALVNVERVYKQERQYNNAEYYANQIIEKYPNNSTGYMLLLELYVFDMPNKNDKVPNLARQAYEKTGDKQFVTVEVGYYEKKQDYKKAATLLAQWLQQNPNAQDKILVDGWLKNLQSKAK